MRTHERYVAAMLQNPEWIKNVQARFGGNQVTEEQLATAVLKLNRALEGMFGEPEPTKVSDKYGDDHPYSCTCLNCQYPWKNEEKDEL